jgi:DNA invertase Pin-like site-specific DNA recombinase
VHILAAVAQHERELISERTKAALAAAKRRGKRLGNPNLPKAAKRGVAALKANARRFAANVRPIIEEIMRAGRRATTLLPPSSTSAMSARRAAGCGRMCRWGQSSTLSKAQASPPHDRQARQTVSARSRLS